MILESLKWQELTLEVYKSRRQFEKCAAIALEIRDFAQAPHF